MITNWDLHPNHFGFIYTSIVLQHIASPHNRNYLMELVRLLRPGGILVIQIPDRLRESLLRRLRTRLALRSRLRRWLRQKDFVMEMNCVPEAEVRSLIRSAGANVLDVRVTNSTDPTFSGNLRYLGSEPERGYVSKQYCVVKDGRSCATTSCGP